MAVSLGINTARRPAEDRWSRNWHAFLPASWRKQVIEALDFTEHREYEMAARRCFYAHDYALDAMRSDDDEEFYPVVTYGETVRAWRLRDGRWLIYRAIDTGDAGDKPSAFYSFSEQAPF